MHRVQAGANVVVHCNAGIGRTGMFLAAFRKRAEGCTGEEAVAWIRQYIPSAVETPEQRQLVCECFGAE
jgi:protein-tyrosine phosphatase